MGVVPDFLVSERMAAAFHAEGLTGLDGFHPVEVVKQNARARRLGCRSPGNEGIYGFKLEVGTWEGLDTFHGFTNIKLMPTEQFVWDPLRKGRPRRWRGPDRAGAAVKPIVSNLATSRR